MQINLSELFVSDGKEKTYQVPLEMDTFAQNGGAYPILEKSEVTLNARHEKDRQVTLTGKVNLTVEFPCDRCLGPVAYPFALGFEKELDMNASYQDRVDALDEQPFIDGYSIDVDLLVYGELLVNLPMKVLCSESCKGICNRCGANLNTEQCQCDNLELDPRMAAIRDIFNNFKEV